DIDTRHISRLFSLMQGGWAVKGQDGLNRFRKNEWNGAFQKKTGRTGDHPTTSSSPIRLLVLYLPVFPFPFQHSPLSIVFCFPDGFLAKPPALALYDKKINRRTEVPH